MNLKEKFWSKQTDPNGSQSPSPFSPRGVETEAAPGAATSAVEELINSLSRQRIYREITHALLTGLRDARAEFSFLRVNGLRLLLKSLRSIAQSDSSIVLFSHAQSIAELQVVPVLFEHSLKETEDDRVGSLDHIFSLEPMKINSPSTDAEVSLALRVLEGFCLLHPESTRLAHQHKAIPVLMNVLSTQGGLEQGACLDALISIMLDSSANQMDFESCNGIEEVADLIRDKQVDENLRQRSPMATIHEDVRRLLGEKSASLIWAASKFGSTLDPDQRLPALHTEARRVLESLDLY